MTRSAVGIIVVALFALNSVFALRYDGYQVVRVQPSTDDQLKFVIDFLHENPQYDVFLEPSVVGRPVDVLLPPEDANKVSAKFAQHGVMHHATDENIQRSIDDFFNRVNSKNVQSELEWFDNYHRFEDIMDWIDEKAELCGPLICKVENIGTSFEGRDLKVMKMGFPSEDGQPKPVVWIDAGIHAREWIAHATGQFIIEMLLDLSDPVVDALLRNYDWYIMPVMNPDGYVFSWDEDRLWRKTRQTYGNTTCIGADANRNFDFMWMTIGASDDPCTITFAGFQPYSEPETKAVSTFLSGIEKRITLYMTLHSYGQLWMSPYGYTSEEPENHDELVRAGTEAARVLELVHGTHYRVGAASSILYFSSGTSRDWAASRNIDYVYTLELRDQDGFVLPPEEIRPTGEETWAAIRHLVYTEIPVPEK